MPDDQPQKPEEMLGARQGLPDDLRFLLENYPRETWVGHENMGPMSDFWLQRHDMFRQLVPALEDGVNQFADKKLEQAKFHPWFIQGFNFLIEQLHSHHSVEDHHYFPVLMKAEKRLERGFDLLDRDHKAIHLVLMSTLEAGKALDEALRQDPMRLAFATDAMAKSFAGFNKDLTRHLEDEEELVIPLILDRGEAALGVH